MYFTPSLITSDTNKNYSIARIKNVFAQKCMRFCIPDILKKPSSIITDEIKTQSRKRFLVYLECYLVNEHNCALGRCLLEFFGLVLSYFMSMQTANFNVLDIVNLCFFFALIHRLCSYLSASPSSLMLIFDDWTSLYLAVSPRCKQFFRNIILLF